MGNRRKNEIFYSEGMTFGKKTFRNFEYLTIISRIIWWNNILNREEASTWVSPLRWNLLWLDSDENQAFQVHQRSFQKEDQHRRVMEEYVYIVVHHDKWNSYSIEINPNQSFHKQRLKSLFLTRKEKNESMIERNSWQRFNFNGNIHSITCIQKTFHLYCCPSILFSTLQCCPILTCCIHDGSRITLSISILKRFHSM